MGTRLEMGTIWKSGQYAVPPLTLLFLIDLFLEARAEILTKISLVFGQFEDTKSTFRKLTDL